jgi:hypothetical protein
MRLLKSLAIAACLLAPLGACASISTPQSLQIAETAFSSAQVLYNSICASNSGLSFCSADDMQKANAAANVVRTAIETAINVIGSNGTQEQIDAAVQGVIKAEADFEKLLNLMQAKKAAAMAAHAPR